MGKGATSKLPHVVVGRIPLLTGCWTEGLRSSLAVGQRHQLLTTQVSPQSRVRQGDSKSKHPKTKSVFFAT